MRAMTSTGPLARARREWRYLTGLARTLLRVRSIAPESRRLVCDDLEDAVDRWRERPAIRFEGAVLTAAADPPEDPPGTSLASDPARFHGFSTGP